MEIVSLTGWLLERNLVRCAFCHSPPSFVVNLSGRHVPVSEEIANTADVDPGIEEQCGDGRPQRVRCVDAGLPLRAIRPLVFLHGARQPGQVAGEQHIHRRRRKRAVRELHAPRVQPRPEEGTARNPRHREVLRDRLGGGEVQADLPAAVPLLLKFHRGAAFVLVEVPDFEPATRRQSGTGIEIEFEDGAIAVIEHRFAVRHAEELPRPARRQRLGFVHGVRRVPGNELGVRWIRHDDRQAKLGGNAAEVFIETRHGGYATADRLRRHACAYHMIAPVLDVADFHREEIHRIVRPPDAEVSDECHDILPVRSPRVWARPPLDPSLEDLSDGKTEGFDTLRNLWCGTAQEDRRQILIAENGNMLRHGCNGEERELPEIRASDDER